MSFIRERGEKQIEVEKESKYKINLRFAKLQDKTGMNGVDLRKAHLEGADFVRANLTSVSFDKANLQEANLAGANLKDAALFDAQLYKANLADAHLCGARLLKANLEDVKFGGTKYNPHTTAFPEGFDLSSLGLQECTSCMGSR